MRTSHRHTSGSLVQMRFLLQMEQRWHFKVPQEPLGRGAPAPAPAPAPSCLAEQQRCHSPGWGRDRRRARSQHCRLRDGTGQEGPWGQREGGAGMQQEPLTWHSRHVSDWSSQQRGHRPEPPGDWRSSVCWGTGSSPVPTGLPAQSTGTTEPTEPPPCSRATPKPLGPRFVSLRTLLQWHRLHPGSCAAHSNCTSDLALGKNWN